MQEMNHENIDLSETVQLATPVHKKAKTILLSFQLSLLSYALCLSLVLLYLFIPFEECLILLPIVLMDMLLFVKDFPLFKLENSPAMFSLLLDRQIAYISEVITLSLLCVYLEWEEISFFISGLPLYLMVFLALHLNKKLKEPLEKLLNLIHFTIRVTKAFLFIGISLKTEGDLDWSQVLIPFVVLFGMLFIIVSVIALRKKLIPLFALSMFCLVAVYVCINLLRSVRDKSNYMTGPIICALVFIITLLGVSLFLQRKILRWAARKDGCGFISSVEHPDIYLRRISDSLFQLYDREQQNNDNPQEFNENCSICYERNASIVFADCYHGGVCSKCALSIFVQARTCHLCRERISKLYQIENKGEFFSVTRQFEFK